MDSFFETEQVEDGLYGFGFGFGFGFGLDPITHNPYHNLKEVMTFA